MSIRNEYSYILKNKSKEISFLTDSHQYFRGSDEYASVTKLISNYKPEFDKSGFIIKLCAKKKGISVKKLREEWDKAGTDASEFGTKIHELAEKNMLNINSLDMYEEQYINWMTSVKKIKNLLTYKLELLDTETIVYSEKYKVAGQIDLLMLNKNGQIELYDWKTNKDLSNNNKNNESLLYSLGHLENTKMNVYALQLSMYRYLLESWGLNVWSQTVIHVKENDFNMIPVTYLKSEVEYILEKGW